MRRLLPPVPEPAASHAGAASQVGAVPVEGEEGPGALGALAAAYPYPPREAGSYLRANMVGSLDGAAHYEGRSAPLSSPADMRVFGVLRALADVVVVGAETARQEGYRPAKARAAFAARRAADGQAPAPAIAVVSRSLDLDLASPLFTGPVVPTLVLTGAGAPAERRAAAERAGRGWWSRARARGSTRSGWCGSWPRSAI